MDPSTIQNRIVSELGADSVSELQTERCDPTLVVDRRNLLKVCRLLRDAEDLAFDYLQLVSGVDTGEGLVSVYHLYSITHAHALTLKVELSYDDPEVDSVAAIWPAADWHERETFDMMGIRFKGHPGLERILCPEDWEGHPLRKDYVQPEEYHGISND